MGAKQSAAHTDKAASACTSTGAPSAPLLPFGVVLQGLSGSGVSGVQQSASLLASQVLHVDERFLTQPPIYSTEWPSINHPGFSRGLDFDLDGPNQADHSAWWYGGRGGTSAVWSLAAHMTSAVIFVVDSTDRARMARTADSPPLQPESFVANYMSRSEEERAEIFARLRADMTARDTLHTLLQQDGVRHKSLLVLATKQDQPGALPPAEIAALLGLSDLVSIDWRLSGCDARTGEGIPEAMHWLRHVVDAPTDFAEERMREFHESQAKLQVLREAAETDAMRTQKDGQTEAELHNDTNTTAEAQQQPQVGTVQTVAAEGETLASTPTATATPPSETHVDPAPPPAESGALPQEEGRKEGQRSSASVAPTTSETNGLAPLELQAEVGHADADSAAEGVEGVTPAAQVDALAAAPNPPPFASLSSTHLALPPQPSHLEPVAIVRRKKHWYSRSKLVPKEAPIDIYSYSRAGSVGLL